MRSLLGRAQRGVLDHQRSLERELLDELRAPRCSSAAAPWCGCRSRGRAAAPWTAAGRRRRSVSPSASTSSGGISWLAARVLDEDRLGVRVRRRARGGTRAGRPDDVLAQGALEVAVRADDLRYSIRSSSSRISSVACSASSASWVDPRERLSGLLDRDAPAIPPGAAAGSRSRRAGARCARRSSAPARSRARCAPPRRPRAAPPRRRSCPAGHRRRAARRPRGWAADRDRDQRFDPEGVGPPAGDQGRRRASP